MPCRNDEVDPNAGTRALRNELDRITDMLCRTLRAVDNLGEPGPYPEDNDTISMSELDADIQAWWRAHEIEDAKRQKREEINAQIAKLQKKLQDL